MMQEYFDKIMARALEMEKPALNGQGKCSYRSVNGPCLIGALITDVEAARADALYLGVYNAYNCGYFNQTFEHLTEQELEFLRRCQIAHDSVADADTLDWAGEDSKEMMIKNLQVIGKEYGLVV